MQQTDFYIELERDFETKKEYSPSDEDDRWEVYEILKRKVKAENLSPEEYEREIKDLVTNLDI